MNKFGLLIAKNRVIVIVICALLVLPSLYGMATTRVNYDLLTYLPKNLDSMKGQEILNDVFNNSATSMLIAENMNAKDISNIRDKISQIEGVENVFGINDIIDGRVPKEILPDKLQKTFYSKNSTLLLIQFKGAAGSDLTQNALDEIRKCLDKQCFLSGIAVIIKDTIDLANKEIPLYVLIAVIFATIILVVTMESTIIPFIFLTGIGAAILYNLGTNVFFGEISYITKAIAAVLQLGVTMDYSIFLYHRYEEEKKNFAAKEEAMADAISKTVVSITGSSLTTIAGFLALCFMKLGLGSDMGFVMAKGVVFGMLSAVTLLPALILVFDKYIDKYSHRTLMPQFSHVSGFVIKNYKLLLVVFLIAFIPSIYGQMHTPVYYNLDESLPKDMESIVALNKLKTDYNMMTTHMIIINDKIPSYKVREMVKKIEAVDGVESVAAYDKYIGPRVPDSFIPDDIRDIFTKNGYRLIVANSKYKAAQNQENQQINEINRILKSYDPHAMMAGEGPLTKDLIELADIDFKNVSYSSILAVFVIILLVFASASIPVILVLCIQLAIFVNMAIPFYTGEVIPFVASIVIGTIQLGATVDYAILLTTRFREELRTGKDKFAAMEIAIKSSIRSIVTSALSFFAATVSVGLISNIKIIKSLCIMISRGALISVAAIILVLPPVLLASERLIAATTKNWRTIPKIKMRLAEERE